MSPSALKPTLTVLVAMSALQPIALNLLAPAAPALSRHFGSSYATIQLALTFFLVAVALTQLVSGPLSDRFGLWLGFHNGTQDQYFEMVRGYVAHHKLKIKDDELIAQALEWSMTRGARSGRVAWQFIEDLAGELGQRLAVAVDK